MATEGMLIIQLQIRLLIFTVCMVSALSGLYHLRHHLGDDWRRTMHIIVTLTWMDERSWTFRKSAPLFVVMLQSVLRWTFSWVRRADFVNFIL